ncbi:MAG: c-type cytochrome [Bacteroidota bacterium]
MRFKTQFFLLLILSVSTGIRVSAQTWVVPDDQKAITAPAKFTPDMQKQGELIYTKNCQSCHGLPGKDNWVKQLVPPPGDLAKEKAQKQTDGEIFFRITTGKAPMPEFRNIIAEDDRWSVIAFLRSFNPKYVQPAPAAKVAFTGRIVTLAMQYNEQMKKIVVTAREKLKDSDNAPAGGIEVLLSVKRYFGSMQVGDMKTTNSHGEAFFEFPADLPGNSAGNVELTARVNDPRSQMKTTPVSATLAIGVPTNKPGLTEARAWWSTRNHAPIWLLLTYCLSVIVVWGFIVYIVASILKIKKLSRV